MENTKSKSSGIVKKLLLILILIVLIGLIAAYFIGSYTYSEGSRAGLLIKFSHRGYMVKTYEGELNLGGIQPTQYTVGMNSIWKFSVKNDSIAKVLMRSEGKNLSLHYKEAIHNFFWQGDTKYFVDGVVEIQEQ